MITLKQENFGGIAFNPENGHELRLDHELFNSLKNKQTNTKVQEVYKQLAVINPTFKIIPQSQALEDKFPFTVLNSPVLADINITNKCNLSCPHCYINSNKNGTHMSLSDFRLALDQCKKAGVLQIALGGGEPTLHPDFPTIIKETRKAGIVPNLTTNGKHLSFKTVYYLAQYAGAVALSIEEIGKEFEKRRGFPFSDFVKSAKKLKAAGIKLVFQITLSKGNLSRVNQTVKYLLKYKPYGILFLAYKPQGRGKNYDSPLSLASQQQVSQVLKSIFKDLKGKTKIGFDCCLTPALMNVEQNPSFKGCSASRESVAIMPDLQVLPCSFLNNKEHFDNLNEKGLTDIWQSEKFNNFRKQISKKTSQATCMKCSQNNTCLGGCPAFELTKCRGL